MHSHDRAQVLPAEGRGDRLTRAAVPHDRARPLVGDPDGGDRPPGGGGGLGGGVDRQAGDVGGVELDQAGERRRRRRRAGRPSRRSRGRRRPPRRASVVVPTSMTRIAVTPASCHAVSGRCVVTGPDRRLDAAIAQVLAEEPADQPGGEHDGQVEHHREPAHVEAADQADHDEHGLGGEVRAGGGHEAVAQRRARCAAPTPRTRRRARSRHGADVEPHGERAVVTAVGGPAAGDRERHGEDEGDEPAGPDRIPVPAHRRRVTARAPARTGSPGRACPG